MKILLADDRSFIRISLENIIGKHTMDEAWGADIILNKIKMEDFHLIVMDVNMRGIDSLGLVVEILTLRPEARILMFCTDKGDIQAKKFLQAGAMGYLDNIHEPEIKKAVESVLSNKKYISPRLLENLLQDTISERSKNPFDLLSKREMEITHFILAGETPASISIMLGVDTSTIGNYRSRIFSKLGCKTVEGIRLLANNHVTF